MGNSTSQRILLDHVGGTYIHTHSSLSIVETSELYVSDTADDHGNFLVSAVSHHHDVIAVFACHARDCMYSLCPPFIPRAHYFIPHPTSQAFAQSLVYTCTCVGPPCLCDLRTVVKRILLITWPLDTVMQPGVNRAQCWVLRTACAYIHLYIRTYIWCETRRQVALCIIVPLHITVMHGILMYVRTWYTVISGASV